MKRTHLVPTLQALVAALLHLGSGFSVLGGKPTQRRHRLRTADALGLDPAVRDALVTRLCAALEGAAPGSVVRLRGSLAEGRADAYSDIDLLWEVPDEAFEDAIERISELLSRAQPVESLRSDPDFQRSDRRRLFFVQFCGMPLFWRADIDVLARSLGGDLSYDADNPSARGGEWSRTHSALMNAIAAVKALLRGEKEKARGLLDRGYARAGLPTPEVGLRAQILRLAEGIAATDPAQHDLASRVVDLHERAFGEGESTSQLRD